MGEPGGLPSMGSHRVGHDGSHLAAAAVKITAAERWLKTVHVYSILLDFWRPEVQNQCC